MSENYELATPEVVFFDLDGTLVNSNGKIGDRCKAAVQRLHDRKVQVAVATGRPLFAAFPILEELSITAPSMFFSGALIYSPDQKISIHEETLSPEQVGRILEVSKKRGFYCELYTRESYYVEKTGPFTDIHAEYLYILPVCESLKKVSESLPILKAVLVLDLEDGEVNFDEFSSLFPNMAVATGYGAGHQHIAFVNLTSTAASREACFEKFLKVFQVDPSAVMAFGDAEADHAFISLAGVGVAMGDAPDSLRRAADFVAAPVNDHGVACFLEEKLGL